MKIFPATAALFVALLASTASWAQVNTPAVHWIRGTVVKADVPRQRITLAHEAFSMPKLSMDAMTMPFKVRDAAPLATLKPGDKVRFALVLEQDELFITRLEAAP